MAEKQQAHRISMEDAGLTAAIRQDKRGQWLGFAAIVVAIVGAVVSVHLGAHWSVSVALVGVTILGMVKALMRPRDS